MRAQPRPPRRVLAWILAGAAAIALTVAGTVWITDRWNTDDSRARPGTTADATAAPATDPEPTGCLGGNARDTAMVLTAQDQAPHTSNGAVEVAAALARWALRSPVPDQTEAREVQAALIAPSSGYNLPTALAGNPNLSGSLVPDGTDFYVSTVPGMWHLESYSDEDAVVSVGVGVVIDGQLHPQFRISTMYTLRWTAGGWIVAEANPPRTTEELFAIGTPFTGGC